MNSGMDLGVILRFLLRTLGVFALIFIFALLTPKIAKVVDRWIARYREHHAPEQDETYGVRSIYDLPPKEEDDEEPDSEDIPEELPEEAAEELPEEALEEAAEDAPEETPEEPAENAAEEIPEAVLPDRTDDDDGEWDDDDDDEWDDEFYEDDGMPGLPVIDLDSWHRPAPQENASAQEDDTPWFMR